MVSITLDNNLRCIDNVFKNKVSYSLTIICEVILDEWELSMMPVEIENHGDRILVKLDGQMYVPDAAMLRERLLQLVEKGTHSVDVNMSRLDFIDSAGLGVLIGIHKRLMERGGHMTLTGLRGSVKELFTLTRLDKVFDIQND
jgi:anti-sigma B factor antagonist